MICRRHGLRCLSARSGDGGTSLRVAMLCAALLGISTVASATIPGTERQALIDLYNSSNGDTWTANTNWCNGFCPASGTPIFNAAGTECTWFGVTCDAGQNNVI